MRREVGIIGSSKNKRNERERERSLSISSAVQQIIFEEYKVEWCEECYENESVK